MTKFFIEHKVNSFPKKSDWSVVSNFSKLNNTIPSAPQIRSTVSNIDEVKRKMKLEELRIYLIERKNNANDPFKNL